MVVQYPSGARSVSHPAVRFGKPSVDGGDEMKKSGLLALAALFCFLTAMAGSAMAWRVKVINTTSANIVVKECHFNGDCQEATIDTGAGQFCIIYTDTHCPKKLSGTFSYFYYPELQMKTITLKETDDLPCRHSTWEICKKGGLDNTKYNLLNDNDWGFCRQ
jgi:hypothetical protein